MIGAVEAAQRAAGIHLKSYLLLPTWDDPPYYSLLIEESDLASSETTSIWPLPSTASSDLGTSNTSASVTP